MNNIKNIYLLDANIFIEAYKRYYSFDIVPTFWERLIDFAQRGKIITIDKVRDEIYKQKDELYEWFKKNFIPYTKNTKTNDILSSYTKIVNWTNQQNKYQFSSEAIDEFLGGDNADAWIIAYALNNNCIVVTHEVFNENIKGKIPIPNVCMDFNIKTINTFEMMRNLNFIL